MPGRFVIPVDKVAPTLESERLRLRPYRSSDTDAMFRLYSDPRVMRYWSFPPWREPAQARAYLERALAESAAGAVLAWAVAEREPQRFARHSLALQFRIQAVADFGASLHRIQREQGERADQAVVGARGQRPGQHATFGHLGERALEVGLGLGAFGPGRETPEQLGGGRLSG